MFLQFRAKLVGCVHGLSNSGPESPRTRCYCNPPDLPRRNRLGYLRYGQVLEGKSARVFRSDRRDDCVRVLENSFGLVGITPDKELNFYLLTEVVGYELQCLASSFRAGPSTVRTSRLDRWHPAVDAPRVHSRLGAVDVRLCIPSCQPQVRSDIDGVRSGSRPVLSKSIVTVVGTLSQCEGVVASQ